MRIISMAYTWPAFVAQKKFVTRRQWQTGYAQSWKAGESFKAWDFSPRAKSLFLKPEAIGVGRLIQAPYLEFSSDMPDEDYGLEGLEYMNSNPALVAEVSDKVDASFFTPEGFKRWRQACDEFWVVRFEVVKIFPNALYRLKRILGEDYQL
jgi:hypothetical protein